MIGTVLLSCYYNTFANYLFTYVTVFIFIFMQYYDYVFLLTLCYYMFLQLNYDLKL